MRLFAQSELASLALTLSLVGAVPGTVDARKSAHHAEHDKKPGLSPEVRQNHEKWLSDLTARVTNPQFVSQIVNSQEYSTELRFYKGDKGFAKESVRFIAAVKARLDVLKKNLPPVVLNQESFLEALDKMDDTSCRVVEAMMDNDPEYGTKVEYGRLLATNYFYRLFAEVVDSSKTPDVLNIKVRPNIDCDGNAMVD